MKTILLSLFQTLIRRVRNAGRPSGRINRERLSASGIDPARFRFREAVPADAEAIARVHVQAFGETHGPSPAYEIRLAQWSTLLGQADSFCFLVENEHGEVVGFASGNRYADETLPDYHGQLNKIYVLRAYHRLGIGTQLLRRVAGRLSGWGISSMLLFGEAGNPSCFFYEKKGGIQLLAPDGSFHGGYGWPSLSVLLH